jgi:hypothetical protein
VVVKEEREDGQSSGQTRDGSIKDSCVSGVWWGKEEEKVERTREKQPYKLLLQARAPAAYITTLCLYRPRGGSNMANLLSLVIMA